MVSHQKNKMASRKKATPRDPSKRMVGFFATPEEKEGLQDAAKDRGITLAELLRQIATGKIPLGEDDDS